MKPKYTLLIIATIAAITFGACTFETDNVPGHLEGMWHMNSIEVLTADSTLHSTQTDLSQQYLYWSFQNKLLELDNKNGDNDTSFIMRFDISDNHLSLHSPYKYDRTNGDKPVTDAAPLLQYGISGLTDEFDYSVSGKELTMQSATHRLRLRKF